MIRFEQNDFVCLCDSISAVCIEKGPGWKLISKFLHSLVVQVVESELFGGLHNGPHSLLF